MKSISVQAIQQAEIMHTPSICHLHINAQHAVGQSRRNAFLLGILWQGKGPAMRSGTGHVDNMLMPILCYA
jgi:hypothetical protein